MGWKSIWRLAEHLKVEPEDVKVLDGAMQPEDELEKWGSKRQLLPSWRKMRGWENGGCDVVIEDL
jgi:hypothetical protein